MGFAIEVKNVFKTYKLYSNNMDRLKEALLPHSNKRYSTDFQALKNVSFTVAKGDIVGIIGTNGSGKSTILKTICGVLQPTSGSIEVDGRVSALLELGAGFNMEYTGVENIRLNGMMHGLSYQKIEEKLPTILEFAEIGDFAYQPVKTYSSGMFARLAFATSINIEPDILIIDEALSVGDMYFQEKCYEKMKQMVQSGATILFVSHSLPAIRNFCNKVLWIERGELRAEGRADSICAQYKHYLDSKQTPVHKTPVAIKNTQIGKERNKLLIASVELDKTCYYMDEDILVTIRLAYRIDKVNFGVGIIIRNNKNEIVTLFNTVRDDIVLTEKYPTITLRICSNDFVEGDYKVCANLCDELIMYPYDRMDDEVTFEILPLKNKRGVPIAEGLFRQKHEWVFDRVQLEARNPT